MTQTFKNCVAFLGKKRENVCRILLLDARGKDAPLGYHHRSWDSVISSLWWYCAGAVLVKVSNKREAMCVQPQTNLIFKNSDHAYQGMNPGWTCVPRLVFISKILMMRCRGVQRLDLNMDNILLHHKIVLNLDIAFILGFRFKWLGWYGFFFNRKTFSLFLPTSAMLSRCLLG